MRGVQSRDRRGVVKRSADPCRLARQVRKFVS
jgi:hypothetical protein